MPSFHLFRGHPVGRLGGQQENEEPVADPHTVQVLLRSSCLLRGEAGLDWTYPGLPVQTAAKWQAQTHFHLCRDLDSGPGLPHLHALLYQVHHDPSSTPLPKMWLRGLRSMLQKSSGDWTHSPNKAVESVHHVSLKSSDNGGRGPRDHSPERGQHWEDRLRWRWGGGVQWGGGGRGADGGPWSQQMDGLWDGLLVSLYIPKTWACEALNMTTSHVLQPQTKPCVGLGAFFNMDSV